MGILVCGGAVMRCPFGAAPSILSVTPENRVFCGMPVATIDCCKPMVNIAPFGMCSSLGNPQVASATAAALGVLTPMPCLPLVTSPWAPGSPKVLIAEKPALSHTSKLLCGFGGVIQITSPGTRIQVP